MKKITYGVLGYSYIYNTETGKEERQESMSTITTDYSPKAEEIAKKTAHNGQYKIFDDGEPEPNPTQADRIEAQVAYTAMMTDTLLEA